MKRFSACRLPSGELRICLVAMLVFWFLTPLVTPVFGWAAAGWSGTAGSSEGCVGWNCDGKNPCTGMGCGSEGPSKDTKAGSTKSTGAESTKSGTTKNTKDSSNASKTKNTKSGPTLPNVESLTGKSKKNDGWSGSRDADTRTDQQRAAKDAPA